MGNFDDAVLSMILAIVREHLRMWGEVPTVEQVREKLRQPGL